MARVFSLGSSANVSSLRLIVCQSCLRQKLWALFQSQWLLENKTFYVFQGRLVHREMIFWVCQILPGKNCCTSLRGEALVYLSVPQGFEDHGGLS